MKSKYKLTGFSRLLVFMLFFAPITYIGASYYNGEDGIEKIKSLLNSSTSLSLDDQITKKNNEISKLENSIILIKEDIDKLEAANKKK